MVTEPCTEHREMERGNGERSAGSSAGRTENRARRAGRGRDGRWAACDHPAVREPWPQAVPIVEVGTRVRTQDNQGGVVRDVRDEDGRLVYLVQLDGQAREQFIAARALKGVWL